MNSSWRAFFCLGFVVFQVTFPGFIALVPTRKNDVQLCRLRWCSNKSLRCTKSLRCLVRFACTLCTKTSRHMRAARVGSWSWGHRLASSQPHARHKKFKFKHGINVHRAHRHLTRSMPHLVVTRVIVWLRASDLETVYCGEGHLRLVLRRVASRRDRNIRPRPACTARSQSPILRP